MRGVALSGLLLSGCLSAPRLESGPAMWLPEAGQWAKRTPAEGCLQAEQRRGARRYYLVGLRQNGRAVGGGMRHLPALTSDDPTAHDLALTARREERASVAMFGLGIAGTAGLMAGFWSDLGPAGRSSAGPTWPLLSASVGTVLLSMPMMVVLGRRADLLDEYGHDLPGVAQGICMLVQERNRARHTPLDSTCVLLRVTE